MFNSQNKHGLLRKQNKLLLFMLETRCAFFGKGPEH